MINAAENVHPIFGGALFFLMLIFIYIEYRKYTLQLRFT